MSERLKGFEEVNAELVDYIQPYINMRLKKQAEQLEKKNMKYTAMCLEKQQETLYSKIIDELIRNGQIKAIGCLKKEELIK